MAAPAMLEADAHVVDAGGGAGDVEQSMADERTAVADDKVVHARLAHCGAVGSRGVGESFAAVGLSSAAGRSSAGPGSMPIHCGCQPF